MSTAAATVLEPRLFPDEVRTRGRSLDFVVLQAIADPGVVPCPICRGRLSEVPGGVRCDGCGSEILRGEESWD